MSRSHCYVCDNCGKHYQTGIGNLGQDVFHSAPAGWVIVISPVQAVESQMYCGLKCAADAELKASMR